MLFCILIVNLSHIYDFSFEIFSPFGYQVLLFGKKNSTNFSLLINYFYISFLLGGSNLSSGINDSSKNRGASKHVHECVLRG